MSIDLLHDKIRKLKCPLIVDFSVRQELLPEHLLQEDTFSGAYRRFATELMSELSGVVPAVRFAFDDFALLGYDGLQLLSELLVRAGELGFYTVLDATQILTPWRAEFAAEVLLGTDTYPCDALLISPYIGTDAIKPFVPYCTNGKKSLFIAVRSPNKSASDLQDLLTGKRLVQSAAAELVNRYGEQIITKCGYSPVCAAVSATSPDGIRNLRAQYKHMFLLVDGLDYPSGNAKNCSFAFDRFGYGAVISVGPSVIAAWKDTEGSDGQDYVPLAVQAAERIKKNILRYITIL